MEFLRVKEGLVLQFMVYLWDNKYKVAQQFMENLGLNNRIVQPLMEYLVDNNHWVTEYL